MLGWVQVCRLQGHYVYYVDVLGSKGQSDYERRAQPSCLPCLLQSGRGGGSEVAQVVLYTQCKMSPVLDTCPLTLS